MEKKGELMGQEINGWTGRVADEWKNSQWADSTEMDTRTVTHTETWKEGRLLQGKGLGEMEGSS